MVLEKIESLRCKLEGIEQSEVKLLERIVNSISNWFNRFIPRRSNLVEHAKKELQLAGLFDKDSDYGGMIGESVMELIKVLSKHGHSGLSHSITMQVFNKVADFKVLTSITNNPDEWMEITNGGKNSPPLWQSNRQCSCFSNDGGKTYYDIDEKLIKGKQHRTIYKSEKYTKPDSK